MKQSAFTIATPIKLGQVDQLDSLLDGIGDDIDHNPHLRFEKLDGLHYASFVTVAEHGIDPYLLFEGSVDGSSGAFLKQLINKAPGAVDTIYHHCADYPEAGTQDSKAVMAYLNAHDIGANTFYVGWPGRTVDLIRREQQLRERIEAFLDEQEDSGLRQQAADVIRQRIQDDIAADPTMDWAATATPQPFLVRNGTNVVRLLAVPPGATLLMLVKAAFGRSSRQAAMASKLVLLGMAALVGYLARRLRSEETADDREKRKRPDWEITYARSRHRLAPIARREDFLAQNHLASVTRIKEGWFRRMTLRGVLWAVNFVARVSANKGSLGGISSIHFARWVVDPSGKHLIFLSNFDGSWQSYLNDFIDLAAQGLTAVWTNTDNDIGFPCTKWLVLEGARDEPRFKAYARYSQVRTRVWYCAYPDLSVPNIGNNMQLRDQLFEPLDPAGAEAWLRRL